MTPTNRDQAQAQQQGQPSTYRDPQSLQHTVAVIGERLLGLIARFDDHVVSDNKFQDQMFTHQVETQKALHEIKERLAGWRGSALAATAAVSAVWALVVLALTVWKG